VPNASSYVVRFSKSPSGPFTVVATPPANNASLTITDPASSGYYYVTAVTGGAEGLPSNLAQALFFSQCP
jgi:hypothetical protein